MSDFQGVSDEVLAITYEEYLNVSRKYSWTNINVVISLSVNSGFPAQEFDPFTFVPVIDQHEYDGEQVNHGYTCHVNAPRKDLGRHP